MCYEQCLKQTSATISMSSNVNTEKRRVPVWGWEVRAYSGAHTWREELDPRVGRRKRDNNAPLGADVGKIWSCATGFRVIYPISGVCAERK